MTTDPDSPTAVRRLELDRRCAERRFRADALHQAIVFHRDIKTWFQVNDPESHIEPTPGDVVTTAAKFLAFIENKRVRP